MKLLLDTHVLLWWLSDPGHLSSEAQVAIKDVGNEVLISAAVVWEIAIKSSLGKLSMPEDLERVIELSSFGHLPIEFSHTLAVLDLVMLHRDPFDRILIAQAIVEKATLVTRDTNILKYSIAAIEA